MRRRASRSSGETLRPPRPPSLPPVLASSRVVRPNLSFLNFLLISYSSHGIAMVALDRRDGHRNPHRCTDGMSSPIFRSTIRRSSNTLPSRSPRILDLPSRRCHLSSSIFAVYALSILSGRRRNAFFRKRSCVPSAFVKRDTEYRIRYLLITRNEIEAIDYLSLSFTHTYINIDYYN